MNDSHQRQIIFTMICGELNNQRWDSADKVQLKTSTTLRCKAAVSGAGAMNLQ